jgi:hypothetical protein
MITFGIICDQALKTDICHGRRKAAVTGKRRKGSPSKAVLRNSF